jgi:hypothetical protein
MRIAHAYHFARKLSATVLVAVAVLAIAGCGGSSSKSSATTTSTTTTTGTTKKKSHVAKAAISETLRSVKGAKTFASSLAVKAGDAVQLRTILPGKPTDPAQKVQLKIDMRKAGTITVTATANGQSSTATITPSKKSLKLAELRYTCELPPTPTVCPASSVKGGASGYQLQFSVRPHSALALVGLMSTTTAPPSSKLPAAGTSVVPPYKVVEKVRAVAPNPGGPAKTAAPFATSAAAHPGDLVVLATHLAAKLKGAPQTVTVKFSPGPSKSITVTASVSGGTASTATITSATGSPISLALPRYTCFVAPYPTFCPLKSVHAGNGQDTIQLSASPSTPAFALIATAQ